MPSKFRKNCENHCVRNRTIYTSRYYANVGETIVWIHDPSLTPTKFHSIGSSEKPADAEQFNYSFRAQEKEKVYVVKVPGTYNYYCYPHVLTLKVPLRLRTLHR